MLSIAGIVASLALLMWFAYRGISVLLLAPLAALVAVLATPTRGISVTPPPWFHTSRSTWPAASRCGVARALATSG